MTCASRNFSPSLSRSPPPPFRPPAAAAFSGADAAYASVGGDTSIPYGWIDFCQRYKGECAGPALPATDVNLTDAALREIQQVNSFVNHAVEPVSDMDHWGVVDRWDYPIDGKGDCEDYALMKRKMLIERGFPRQAVLITVVRDENNEGHAILTVKTNHGEYHPRQPERRSEAGQPASPIVWSSARASRTRISGSRLARPPPRSSPRAEKFAKEQRKPRSGGVFF